MSVNNELAKSIYEQNKLKQRIWQKEMKAELAETEEKTVEPKDLPDDFNCPICCEPMNTTEHTPITLSPCGHTICQTCVESYQKTISKQRCPFCSQPYKYKAINHSIIGIADSISDETDEIDFKRMLNMAENKLEALLSSYDLCKSRIEQTEKALAVARAVMGEMEGDLAEAEKRHRATKEKLEAAQIESEKAVIEEQRLEEIVTILRREHARLSLEMEIYEAGKA